MLLSNADADHLHATFGCAMDHIAAGDSPDDAAYKAAKAQKLGPHGVEVLCRTLNVGRQSDLRDGADDAGQIFQKFALADADAVNARLTQAATKEAAAAATSEDFAPPVFYRRPAPAFTVREKAAAAPAPPPTPEPIYAVKVAHAKQACRGADRAADRAQVRYKAACRLAAAAIADAAAQLTDANAAEYRYAVGLRYGKAAADRLFALINPKAPATPPAVTGVVAWDRDDYRKFAACFEAGRKAAALKQAASEANDSYLVAAEHYAKLAADNGRPLADYLDVDDGSPDFAIRLPSLRKAAGFFEGLTTGYILPKSQQIITGPPRNEVMLKRLDQLSDPNHDADLRKVRAQGILSKLMSDPDDPISGYDPQLVLQKYNELSDMAPRLADKPVLLRPWLNRVLAGHTQPFEGKALLDAEKGLQEMDPAMPPDEMIQQLPGAAK
jgi:hypothetical protein